MALPPEGVNFTEEMVRSAVPQFQDTPTSINRSVPVPVVCAKVTLLALAAPVPLDGVPSTPSDIGTYCSKVAVTALLPFMVTVCGLAPSARSPLQPANSYPKAGVAVSKTWSP